MGNYCCEEKAKQRFLKKKVSSKRSTHRSSFTDHVRISSQSQTISPILGDLLDNPSFKYYAEIVGELGKGAQGCVLYARIFPEGEMREIQAAVKVIQKSKLKKNEGRYSIGLQHRILSQFSCSFLVKSIFSQETAQSIEFYMPVYQGNNLRTFCEDTFGKELAFRTTGIEGIRFVICGIVAGLAFLHRRRIVHRDLKLQNVLINSEGYPALCDFGHSSQEARIKRGSLIGTLPYISPEAFFESESDRSVDLWSLGVLVYFLVFKEFPFLETENTSDKFPEICRKHEGKYTLKRTKFKQQLSQKEDLADLLNKLLVVDREKRLGYEDIQDLKSHKFFSSIDWVKYQNKQYKSPLKKIVKDFKLNFEPYEERTFIVRSPKLKQCLSQNGTCKIGDSKKTLTTLSSSYEFQVKTVC